MHVIPNYSYQVRRFCGKGFISVWDAHRFIHPIFSFGISATLRDYRGMDVCTLVLTALLNSTPFVVKRETNPKLEWNPGAANDRR